MSQGQEPALALAQNDMAKEVSHAESTSGDFFITKLFLCTWHGNMGGKPARLVDVTSAISKPNDRTPEDLISSAQKATTDLLRYGNAVERYILYILRHTPASPPPSILPSARSSRPDKKSSSYRATKSKMSTFTVTTPESSTPLATFRVPISCGADVPINFHPSANSNPPKSTYALHRTSWGQLLTGCNHSFVHNNETFTWAFASGTEMILRDTQSRILAKFYHAPSWFQSGGVLAIGEEEARQGKVTEQDYEHKQQHQQQQQQQPQWEQTVVVTLLAFLRREREWRYAIAGLIFPIKRGAFGGKKKEARNDGGGGVGGAKAPEIIGPEGQSQKQ